MIPPLKTQKTNLFLIRTTLEHIIERGVIFITNVSIIIVSTVYITITYDICIFVIFVIFVGVIFVNKRECDV
jgi:hypothetical protein